MKVSVYDSYNKDRLLGTLDHERDKWVVGDILKCAYRPVTSPFGARSTNPFVYFTIDVRFHSRQQVIDPITTETTRWERRCLLTDAPLTELMRLEGFTVAGGSENPPTERTQRRVSSPYCDY